MAIAATFALLLFTLAFFYIGRKKQKGAAEQDARGPIYPSHMHFKGLKPNDKLTIVKNVSLSDIRKVLTNFCQLYNQEKIQAAPRLICLSATSFAITFPLGIASEIFCFFINFLKYPIDVHWQADVTGWTTTDTDEIWHFPAVMNRKAMLYISDTDSEYCSVYLTTEDNAGFRIGFSKGDCEAFDVSEKPYRLPDVDRNTINRLPEEYFHA